MFAKDEKISIRVMSDYTGVSVPNIRMWEKRYGLFKPDRNSANIRYYSLSDLSRVVLLKYLVDQKYRISKVAPYTVGELRNFVVSEMKEGAGANFEKQKLISLLIENDIEAFDEFIKICLGGIASVDFIIKVLEPVMRLIKVIGHLKDNNLHFDRFVANKVLLRMLSSVDEISAEVTDRHEMLIFQSDVFNIPVNLSIVNYLATSKKYRTNIILNKIQTEFFLTLKKEINPDIIYTEFNEEQTVKEIIDGLSILQKTFPLSKVIISGSRLEKVWKSIPNKIYIIRDLDVMLRSI